MNPYEACWENITPADFCAWFRCKESDLGARPLATLRKGDFRWKPAGKDERERYLMNYLPKLKSSWIERDREKNREAWSVGWAESLAEIRAKGPSPLTCRPKYFRGSEFLRLQGDLVVTPNLSLENELLNVTREHLFFKYLADASAIYELGCGSGQNLLLLAEMFPQKKVVGLDWVEPCVEIAGEIGKKYPNVSGKIFDMTEPDKNLKLPPGAAFVSIHAMEQIGDRHFRLLEWMLSQRPKWVVQHEPILEFYDPANWLDYLAIWYSEKRNYLNGYFTALQKYEQQRVIKIEEAYRPRVGGVFHEASVLVWRPKLSHA
jgi:SAM-dependent methyltransferase